MRRRKEEGLKKMLKKKENLEGKKLFKWVTNLKLESVKKNGEERWNVMLKEKVKKKWTWLKRKCKLVKLNANFCKQGISL